MLKLTDAPHHAEVYEYALPLRQPLTTPSPGTAAATESATRKGILIILSDKNGKVGIGEIAPLPGLHKESLIEVMEKISPDITLSTLHSLPDLLSVKCGVEMTLFSLPARQQNTLPFQDTVQPSPITRLPLNALLTGTKEAIIKQAEEAVKDGYTTLKIKVGRGAPKDDIAAVRACRDAVGKDIALRLDANCSWKLTTAIRVGEALQDCNIAYIEEPMRNYWEIEAFYNATGIRVALDETLYTDNPTQKGFRHNIPSHCLAAYVLKPSAIGSIIEARSLALEANNRGLDAVISSVFESGVALGFYATMAAAWNDGRAVACGLDTYKFLDGDVLKTPFTATQGSVSVYDVWNNSQQLNMSVLKRIL